jgi:hypothetical protein
MKTVWKWYARKYNCSIATAIADRDFPMTLKECEQHFIESCGRAPTADEIEEMRPSSQAQVQEEISYLSR